jgi:hypothetical protein
LCVVTSVPILLALEHYTRNLILEKDEPLDVGRGSSEKSMSLTLVNSSYEIP